MTKNNEYKKLRLKRMETQQEFANKMHVHRETVGKWERGMQKPKAVHLRRMARLNKKRG